MPVCMCACARCCVRMARAVARRALHVFRPARGDAGILPAPSALPRAAAAARHLHTRLLPPPPSAKSLRAAVLPQRFPPSLPHTTPYHHLIPTKGHDAVPSDGIMRGMASLYLPLVPFSGSFVAGSVCSRQQAAGRRPGWDITIIRKSARSGGTDGQRRKARLLLSTCLLLKMLKKLQISSFSG